MTAYRLSLVERMARDAGLTLVQGQIPGYWSGAEVGWVGTQDLVVFTR
jgi:hypothetical protein